MNASDLVHDAAVASIGGAFVLMAKWLDKYFPGRKAPEDMATALRNELRKANLALESRVEKLESEVQRWRELYYQRDQEYRLLSVKYEALKAELDELREGITNGETREPADGFEKKDGED